VERRQQLQEECRWGGGDSHNHRKNAAELVALRLISSSPMAAQ